VEVDNPDPILGDITAPATDEIKRRALDMYAMQNRAVTAQDYKAAIYSMPGQFGSVKRCHVSRDVDSARRNLKIHVISEDANGNFIATNETIKNNLRNYLKNNEIIDELEVPKEIGEPFNKIDIVSVLKNIDGVVQVVDVKLVNKSGGLYSDEEFDIQNNLSKDGLVLSVKENMVLEVKYPFSDIIGSVS
jgi:hypothetical protein